MSTRPTALVLLGLALVAAALGICWRFNSDMQRAGATFIGFDEGDHTWVGHDAEVRAEIVKLVMKAAQP